MDERAANAIFLAASLLVACGQPAVAPDAGLDAGPDAGVDASLDAGPDAGQDAGGDGGGGFRIALALHRIDVPADAGPSPILAVVAAADATGAPVPGLAVGVAAGGASFAAAFDGGAYVATVIPPFASGELALQAVIGGVDAGAPQTALVLPFVDARWDQPAPVAGLVNTPGTEDSSTVSPDGQWLIVGTYSPVDVLCCAFGCGGYAPWDGDNPRCDAVLGPVTAPARPGMPGADWVLGPDDIGFADPVMCALEPDGGPVLYSSDAGLYPFAIAPAAVYGFHRQADGSYAEPFLIDTGSDGFVSQPFCLTFLATGAAGDRVPVIFGYNVDAADGGPPHPWSGTVTLGQTNALGTYACETDLVPNYPVFTPDGVTPLPIGPGYQQAGNTSIAFAGVFADGGAFLFSDDEAASTAYCEFSRWDGGAGYSDWAEIALPEPTANRTQPVAAGGRLYYHRGSDVASVTWSGGDPADAGSFGDLETDLQAEATPTGRANQVITVGQPTFAVIDGGLQMFFVYYRSNATGYDGQIGTVIAR